MSPEKQRPVAFRKMKPSFLEMTNGDPEWGYNGTFWKMPCHTEKQE